ncbi:MAG: hypothetical protein OCD76_07455 [Reichenbachiella sp.]
MRQILTILILVTSIVVRAQTVEEIDQLRTEVIKNIDRYKCLEYIDDKILTEDSHQYDTAEFYQNEEGVLVYIKWVSNFHYFHITGDDYGITELFFIDNHVVFRRNYGYSFENPQWHRESNLDETKVLVSESIRRYYKKNGAALMDYESRKVEGKYKDRFTMLDRVTLEEVRRLIWTDRCDACIERDYMIIYQDLLREDKRE